MAWAARARESWGYALRKRAGGNSRGRFKLRAQQRKEALGRSVYIRLGGSWVHRRRDCPPRLIIAARRGGSNTAGTNFRFSLFFPRATPPFLLPPPASVAVAAPHSNCNSAFGRCCSSLADTLNNSDGAYVLRLTGFPTGLHYDDRSMIPILSIGRIYREPILYCTVY